MKNLFVSLTMKAIVMLFLLQAVSCKENENGVSPAGQNNTTYDNAQYSIKTGFIRDAGSVDFFMDDEAEEKTHYNYNFILTDGTPTIRNGSVTSMNDGKIILFASLASPGTASFKTGVFEYDNWLEHLELEDDELLERYRNKYFFPIAFVYMDTDGDKNWQEETGVVVTGGTIRVTGTAPNYTTEYDLTLAGNKTLKGSFSGRFNVVQE